MIKEMTKVQIVGPKTHRDRCIEILHELSIMQIETVLEEKEGFLKKVPVEKEKLEEKKRLEKIREALTELLSVLPTPSSVAPPLRLKKQHIYEEFERLVPLMERAKALYREQEELKEELEMVSRYEHLLRGFVPLVTALGGLKNIEITGLVVDRTVPDVLKLLEEELKRLTKGAYEFHSKVIDEDTIAVVITYQKKYSPQIRHIILGEGIDEIRLPQDYREMPLFEALKEMLKKKMVLPERIESIKRELETISQTHRPLIEGLKRTVEDAIDEIEVLYYFAESRFLFIIEGWVPADRVDHLERELKGEFEEDVLVQVLEPAAEELDRVPVYIENPPYIRPFEIFLRALPPPKYGSVDPTPYVAFFFPTFFGLIVGDVGYGLVVLGAGQFIKRRWKEREFIKNAGVVLSLCGVSAIVFGILFGEFFGTLPEKLGFHPLFERMEGLKLFMLFTLGIGIVHTALGFIIGGLNLIKRGRTEKALEKFTSLILTLVIILMVAAAYNYIPEGLLTPLVVVFIAGVALLLWLEGVVGPLELVRSVGGILSYVRIMAVGTSSVVMAVVADRMAGMSASIFTGILVASLIHLLNIFMTFISPVIQSMRLQYVEFMGRFYEGGGRLYRPFSRR